MRHKRSLKLLLERLPLLCREQGLAFFLPIIVLFIVLPFFSYLANSTYGELQDREMLLFSIASISVMFVPFFSTWWIILAHRNELEADGKELLLLRPTSSAFIEKVLFFFFYIFLLSVLYGFYDLIFSNMFAELIKLMMLSLYYFGIALIVTKLTVSISISILFMFLITMFNVIYSSNQTSFPFFSAYSYIVQFHDLVPYVPFASMGIILFIVYLYLPRRISNR